MSGQYCPDCDHGCMKPASGPGRAPSRCAMCGWEGDLHEVPYESRVPFADVFGDAEADPTVAVTFRVRRNLDEAATRRVWDAVSMLAGDGGSAGWSLRSRHRTFLLPRGSDLVRRILAVDGVERVAADDGELWSRWLKHDIHFVRIRTDGRSDAIEAAIMDVMVPDVERYGWTANGDYLLRLMDPALPGQIAALLKIDGVKTVLRIPPAGPDDGR